MEWDGKYWWYSSFGVGGDTYKIYSNWTYLGEKFSTSGKNIIKKDNYFYKLNDPYSTYLYKYFSENSIVCNVSKFYQGNGYTYIQSNALEELSLKSCKYDQNITLAMGDIINVDFITNLNTEIKLDLYSGNQLNKSYILSPSGNSNFQRHTVTLNVQEMVTFDQIIISSTFSDKKCIILYDIRGDSPQSDHYYEEFYVNPLQNHSLYLKPIGFEGFPLQYNLKIFEEGIKKVDKIVFFDNPSEPYYYTYYSPEIVINSPHTNELLGNTAPSFNIEVINNNGIEKMWYTLDNGLINTTFTANGTINQQLWNSVSNGTVTIKFFIKDSGGNTGNSSVTVKVDKISPLITINSPNSNEIFELIPPNFKIEIIDSNLDKIWYTINEGTKKYFFVTNESIDSTVWSALSDGDITFHFYANDTLGNIGSSAVVIRKDINVPIILINEPYNNDVIGVNAPDFVIHIDELNLESTWYSLNNGINHTFTDFSGKINQTYWEMCPEGSVSIEFFANDTLGNIGYSVVSIEKDNTSPILLINDPLNNDLFESLAPNFSLSVLDSHLNTIWYQLIYGKNIFITELIGTIDQGLWDTLPGDQISILFYAYDTAGNLSFKEIIVRKAISHPDHLEISGFDTVFIIGISFAITLLITKRRSKNQKYKT